MKQAVSFVLLLVACASNTSVTSTQGTQVSTDASTAEPAPRSRPVMNVQGFLLGHVPGPKGFHCFLVEHPKTKRAYGICIRTKKACNIARTKYKDRGRITECQHAKKAHCYLATDPDNMMTWEDCFSSHETCVKFRAMKKKKGPSYLVYGECQETE